MVFKFTFGIYRKKFTSDILEVGSTDKVKVSEFSEP